MPDDETSRTALVTGATRGIGRATAIALARRGFDVAITGRTVREGDAARRSEAAALPELAKVSGSLDSTAAAIEAEGRRCHRIVDQLLAEHRGDGLIALNLQPGAVATERVLAAGEKLEFVARRAAPVEVVGETIARILDTADAFDNGANVQVQDVAKEWGLL